MSDSDFPKDLNSAEKQIKRAKELATQHFGIPTETAKLTEIQGCFSRTVEISLKGGRDIIIQFRIEPLDTEPFTRARSLLGEKVPIIEPIDDPNLVEAERDDVKSFFPFIVILIEDAPALKTLPLLLGHLDLNEMNVFVEESGEITGIVDWELSPHPQLFGIACYCIQYLAGEIVDKVFRERPAFEALDRGFWEGVMENTPESIRVVLNSNLQAVQTSIMIGTFFKIMSIEGGQVFVSEVTLKALPKLMRYQIPALRGSSKAYIDDPRNVCAQRP